MLKFQNARFLTSALKKPPEYPYLQIAVAGRSNVGKSSFLNFLFNHSKLAKVSSVPGKTQTLNFFLIDEQAVIVDLPGYGYAKVSRSTVESWSSAIDSYLENCDKLKLLLVLVDMRRDIKQEEQHMIEWALYHQIPPLVILTKSDKLKTSEKNRKLAHFKKTLASIHPDVKLVSHSILQQSNRKTIINTINGALNG